MLGVEMIIQNDPTAQLRWLYNYVGLPDHLFFPLT